MKEIYVVIKIAENLKDLDTLLPEAYSSKILLNKAINTFIKNNLNKEHKSKYKVLTLNLLEEGDENEHKI